MAKRSLRLSSEGVRKAKQRFAATGWTQEYLALEVGIRTRQPIWRFFSGDPIERFTFFELCKILDIDWREVALNPPAESVDLTAETSSVDSELKSLSLDELVERVRSQRRDKVNYQCGVLQLLDISRPTALEDIYVEVNLLEQISSQQVLKISALNALKPEDVDRFGVGTIPDSQIPGMEAITKYHKFRVLGRPGSGKSTFLRHLALQCNRQNIAINQVPIFINLRDFASTYQNNPQTDLVDYIHQEFITTDISQLSVIKRLLQEGRVLLLIDGLDEVSHEEEPVILNEIRRFTEKYHRNQFVASCRTAAPRLSLKGFTDVEIAPFTEAQIITFAQKWFVEFSKDDPKIADGAQFMKKLDIPENWRFRRLITTPLFLHLACSIFHRQNSFPVKQADFYKQGMDLLLGKWDESKGIQRDQIYRGFLLPQKLRLLSQVASITFEQKQYFFEERVISGHIGEYIQTLPNVNKDPEEISHVSEAVLLAIESQHGLLAERARGIFSFSYLVLQEYFTARKIVASHNLQALGESLQDLVSHITDPCWREIFLLTASMLRSADGLMQLMKQETDSLVAQDPYLQEFLTWASKKSGTNPAKNKPALSRTFYQALTKTPHLAPHCALACTLDEDIVLDAALDNLLQESLLKESKDFAYVHSCGEALSNILGMVVDLGFHKSLQQLRDQLPNSNHHTKESFDKWCENNYATWTEQLERAIATHRNIGSQWEFSPDQKQVLQSYYSANQLLLDCLHGNSEVTTIIREEIEATLLMPQKELESREWA